MSIATVGDNLIHYEVLGRGEPVIFVHGWLGSWRYWWPSMQALSARHRTFAFDFWGFGDSSKYSEKYAFDAYVEMLGDFIDKLGIFKPVTLVGHALGGAVALRYTVQNPDRVQRVASVAVPLVGDAVNERLTTWDSSSVLSRVVGASYPEVDMELRKTDNVAMNSTARDVIQENFIQDALTCPRPFLMIFGDQDPLVKQMTDRLVDTPDSVAYVSLECNHFPMLEQAMKFNRLVLDFTHSDGNLQAIAPKDHWQRRNR